MKFKILLISLILSITLFAGCKTTEYVKVPIETVRTEYEVLKEYVHLLDSINVFIEMKGDTVYVNKFKYKTREVFVKDTVLKTDSIPVIVEVVKTVTTNKLYTWLKVLMWLGGVGLLLLIGTLLNKFKIWK